MDESIKEIVLGLLGKYPDSRDCDGLLAVLWLRVIGIKIEPSYENIRVLNSLKSVWRWRRKVQNEWFAFEASLPVRLSRGVAEREYKSWARKKL